MVPSVQLFMRELAATYAALGCGEHMPAPSCTFVRRVDGIAAIPGLDTGAAAAAAAPQPSSLAPAPATGAGGSAGRAGPDSSTHTSALTSHQLSLGTGSGSYPPAGNNTSNGSYASSAVSSAVLLHPITGPTSNAQQGYQPDVRLPWWTCCSSRLTSQPEQQGSQDSSSKQQLGGQHSNEDRHTSIPGPCQQRPHAQVPSGNWWLNYRSTLNLLQRTLLTKPAPAG
jgi:hypothetical protein